VNRIPTFSTSNRKSPMLRHSFILAPPHGSRRKAAMCLRWAQGLSPNRENLERLDRVQTKSALSPGTGKDDLQTGRRTYLRLS
jgi:hypothetical protein